jgi:bacillithiol synthase
VRAPLTSYPGMNRLVLDWLGGDERFLRRGLLPLRSRSRKIAPALVDALASSNLRWGIDAAQRLNLWSTGEAVTIVAGQQVGFAGGPLYTLAKLATIVRMKRDLESQGIPAVAFFWLATEDHDFDEVSRLDLPVASLPSPTPLARERDLLCIRAARSAELRSAVGSLPLPQSLVSQLLALYDVERPAWLREGITFRDSFAELVASIFGNDVVLIDALEPELRRSGAALFKQIRESEPEIQKRLAARALALSEAGYREQVIAREDEGYTLLFALDDRGIRQSDDGTAPPERTSTSALTRPLLQDAVIQPDVFVGGPAEVAYYAQIAPLHDLLKVTMPRVALRGHALLATPAVARAMERYAIAPAEAFRSVDELLAARETDGVAKILAIAEEGERELRKRVDAIRDLALPADHALERSIQRSIGHLEYHFRKLGERAAKGVGRKDHERHDAIRKVVAALYPDRHVQDRVMAWFPSWCRHGQALVDALIAEIEPDSDHFRIVTL